jgi:hypothetical protein
MKLIIFKQIILLLKIHNIIIYLEKLKLFSITIRIIKVMFNWEPIFIEASEANTKLVYLGIGSAQDHYANNSNINQRMDDTNQQYPPFLKKFEGKKIVILLDPYLEEHLAVEKYMDAHDMVYEKIDVDNVRILRNEEIVVYAIKECFNYTTNLWGTPEEIEQSRVKSDWNVSNLINLISICLEKRTRTKIILQDFTGRNTTQFYSSLFNIFDKTTLLNDVMFDVTQKDGGCFIEMNENQASVDHDGNFIQEKYMELVKITDSPLFKAILKERIQQVVYPLSHNFVSLIKNPSHEIVYKEKLLSLAHTYNIEINELNTNPEYMIQKHEQLIHKVLEDIVSSRNIDASAVGDLIGTIEQRSTFINSLSVFNFD